MPDLLKTRRGKHLGVAYGYAEYENEADVFVSDYDFVTILGSGLKVSPLLLNDEVFPVEIPSDGSFVQLNVTGLYGLHIEAEGTFHIFAGVTGVDF